MNIKVLPLICVFGLAMVTPGAAAGPGPNDCPTTSRPKPFPSRAMNVLRGDGILGSELKNVQFTLIEQRQQNCRVVTGWALDFNIYNHWQRGKPPTGHATAFIDLLSGGRVIKQHAVKFDVPLGFCGPYGQPEGRHFHLEGTLQDNLLDATDSIDINATRISGKIGRC